MNRLTDACLHYGSHEFTAEIDGVKVVIEDNGGDGTVDKVDEQEMSGRKDATEKYREAAQELVTRFQETIKGEAEKVGKELSKNGVSISNRNPFGFRLLFPHSSCRQLVLPPTSEAKEEPSLRLNAFDQFGIRYTLNWPQTVSFSPSDVITSAEDCNNDGYADSAKFITSDGINVFLRMNDRGVLFSDLITMPGSETPAGTKNFKLPSHFFRNSLLTPFDPLFAPEVEINGASPFIGVQPFNFQPFDFQPAIKKPAESEPPKKAGE